MKRVIIAVSMLAFAVTAAFVFTIVLTKNITSISADILHLSSVAQTATHEEICSEADSIISEWNKTQKFLKVISVHESLNAINQNILSLSDISANGNREQLYEKCREICAMLSVFSDDEKITAENIF